MIICADDYGMRDDIDRAILQLCDEGKLSAVSCMVLFERCDAASLRALRAHESRVDIGLHLTLTPEPMALSPPLEGEKLQDFKMLFRRALLRKLNDASMMSLLEQQYELFVKKSGRAPDYIDGHLHTHQLPTIAEVLMNFVRQLPADQRPYVRNTRLSVAELRRKKLPWLKAALIGWFGGGLERRLQAAGLATNAGFSGIYDFAEWRKYAAYFPKFVSCLPEANGILVTHPGFDEDWRRSEWETLRNADVAINRFRR
ncbi:MAG TPA: ChbG/HpnK family deacetylase [Verrucomicrobiaceae bacterium]|jgi:hypothetical protein